MGESLMQRRRVRDDGLRVVNCFSLGRARTVPEEQAPANYVPAAAVIRRGQALSGVTGRKAHAGGPIRVELSLIMRVKYVFLRLLRFPQSTWKTSKPVSKSTLGVL